MAISPLAEIPRKEIYSFWQGRDYSLNGFKAYWEDELFYAGNPSAQKRFMYVDVEFRPGPGQGFFVEATINGRTDAIKRVFVGADQANRDIYKRRVNLGYVGRDLKIGIHAFVGRGVTGIGSGDNAVGLPSFNLVDENGNYIVIEGTSQSNPQDSFLVDESGNNIVVGTDLVTIRESEVSGFHIYSLTYGYQVFPSVTD